MALGIALGCLREPLWGARWGPCGEGGPAHHGKLRSDEGPATNGKSPCYVCVMCRTSLHDPRPRPPSHPSPAHRPSPAAHLPPARGPQGPPLAPWMLQRRPEVLLERHRGTQRGGVAPPAPAPAARPSPPAPVACPPSIARPPPPACPPPPGPIVESYKGVNGVGGKPVNSNNTFTFSTRLLHTAGRLPCKVLIVGTRP